MVNSTIFFTYLFLLICTNTVTSALITALLHLNRVRWGGLTHGCFIWGRTHLCVGSKHSHRMDSKVELVHFFFLISWELVFSLQLLTQGESTLECYLYKHGSSGTDVACWIGSNQVAFDKVILWFDENQKKYKQQSWDLLCIMCRDKLGPHSLTQR